MICNFYDYLFAFLGGSLIALSSSLNLLLNGKITGISGIMKGVAICDKKDLSWKLPFITGLMTFIYFFANFGSGTFQTSNFSFNYIDPKSSALQKISVLSLIVGGIFVGAGTRLGNGCTSGHGVCGIPRFSLRSIVAVLVFMGCGILTATTIYHLNAYLDDRFQSSPEFYKIWKWISLVIILIMIGLSTLYIIISFRGQKNPFESLISLVLGAIFGMGLLVSGMLRPSKIFGFLTISSNWDPSLAFVMVSAVGINLITFNYIIRKRKKPIFEKNLQIPAKTELKGQMIVGNAIFGIGWGISGLCPGPALGDFTVYPQLLAFVPIMIISHLLADYFIKWQQARKQKKSKQQEEVLLKKE